MFSGKTKRVCVCVCALCAHTHTLTCEFGISPRLIVGRHSKLINAWPDLLFIPCIHHCEDSPKTQRVAKQQLPLTEGETAAPTGCSDWPRCAAWEGRYWLRGDTPLESVYVQPESEGGGSGGCWRKGILGLGCDCNGVGGGRAWLCRREEIWEEGELHVHPGKQPLELVQKLLGN